MSEKEQNIVEETPKATKSKATEKPKEFKNDKDAEKFLNLKPSRKEVANFIQNFIHEDVMPQIQEQIAKASSFNSVSYLALNQVLVEKGILKPDDVSNYIARVMNEIAVQRDKMKSESDKAAEQLANIAENAMGVVKMNNDMKVI